MMADAMRAQGRANAHYRTAFDLQEREKDWHHPLAAAHLHVATSFAVDAGELFRRAMRDELMLYERDDRRRPEDWRREGERAARCFTLGVAFAESLEATARLRRRTDSQAREARAAGERLGVVDPRPPRIEAVAS